jgi:hypothetical protein
VTRYQPDGDKIMRLHTRDDRERLLPEKAHRLADYALSG